MALSYWIVAVVMVADALCIGGLYLAQALDKSLPVRHSIIQGTNQRFLYLQDFHTTSWGDLLGLPLIAVAFAHLVLGGKISLWQWMIFGAIAVASVWLFRKSCLTQNHKPDMGFPKAGAIGIVGLLHLPYFGCMFAMSLLCVYHIFSGELNGAVLCLSLAGGALYIASFVADVKCGNFDPLKKIQ